MHGNENLKDVMIIKCAVNLNFSMLFNLLICTIIYFMQTY